MLGACQFSTNGEEIVNDGVETKVEQDSSLEVAESQSTSTVTPIKTTYYDKSLFMLPLDHPYWETTVLNKETIRDIERYGFIDEEVTAENENSKEESKGVSSEKNNGSEKELTEDTTELTSSTSTNTSNSETNDSSSVSKPNNNNNNNNNNNQSSSSTNQPTTPPVVEEKPQPQPPVQPSEPAPQPTPSVVEETKKPVDLLDWNHIKSTLIAKGESLGMRYEDRVTLEDGYESPWQSSYMPVTNEDVIGYIGSQMESIANAGWTWFVLEMVVQADGNVLIYLIDELSIQMRQFLMK